MSPTRPRAMRGSIRVGGRLVRTCRVELLQSPIQIPAQIPSLIPSQIADVLEETRGDRSRARARRPHAHAALDRLAAYRRDCEDPTGMSSYDEIMNARRLIK